MTGGGDPRLALGVDRSALRVRTRSACGHLERGTLNAQRGTPNAKRGSLLRRPRSLLLSLLFALLLAPVLEAQSTEDRLRSQQQELERLRRERRQLEERMSQLQGSIHDLSEEVAIIESRTEATERLVSSLESQLAAINLEVADATAGLIHAEDELAVKRAVLQRRLEDIYKRGPLYDMQVMLAAESFGDLIARYKYLHLLARRDRALVERVEALRDQVQNQRSRLVRLQADIEINRVERAEEERRLRALYTQRASVLARTRRSAGQTQTRIERIARDEERITNVIAELEEARRRMEAAGGARAPGVFTTSEYGQLDWPVGGTVVQNFGREVRANGTAVLHNGIRISAAGAGAPGRRIGETGAPRCLDGDERRRPASHRLWRPGGG